MPIDRTAFTKALAQVPSPVTIITTLDAHGTPWGFTASSFCSLSLSPSLVLVCLAKSAASYDTFSRTDRFLVNVLSEEHTDTAQHFATPAPDKFAHSAMRPCELGLPGLPDASARLACHTNSILDGGDHSILIGQVEATAVSSHTSLTYYQRQFGIPRPHAFQETR
ncbi:flavin reductase family protein [Streptomyces sp. NBC_00212]|uniref:flavin reductase family protein n=1 Tax=Streptomyces sp. NBC_00212 TaxID=2975684 RepID=UPI002F91829F